MPPVRPRGNVSGVARTAAEDLLWRSHDRFQSLPPCDTVRESMRTAWSAPGMATGSDTVLRRLEVVPRFEVHTAYQGGYNWIVLFAALAPEEGYPEMKVF